MLCKVLCVDKCQGEDYDKKSAVWYNGYMKKFLMEYGNYIAWTIALFAMVGSLIFSEVLGYPPCTLCWYQRICLYPLVFIIGTGILRRDPNMPYYALPLAVLGTVVGLYHNLLYYGIIPKTISPCSAGVSCTTKFINWFGFVDIPLLSLVALIIITAILVINLKRNK